MADSEGVRINGSLAEGNDRGGIEVMRLYDASKGVELAAKMADVSELAALPAPPDAPGASPADAYLPSRPLAEALRGLVNRQRAVHDGLTDFARALTDRLKPAADNPFPAFEAEQRALVADLRPDHTDLLEALHRVQHRFGYVSAEAMRVTFSLDLLLFERVGV